MGIWRWRDRSRDCPRSRAAPAKKGPHGGGSCSERPVNALPHASATCRLKIAYQRPRDGSELAECAVKLLSDGWLFKATVLRRMIRTMREMFGFRRMAALFCLAIVLLAALSPVTAGLPPSMLVVICLLAVLVEGLVVPDVHGRIKATEVLALPAFSPRPPPTL